VYERKITKTRKILQPPKRKKKKATYLNGQRGTTALVKNRSFEEGGRNLWPSVMTPEEPAKPS